MLKSSFIKPRYTQIIMMLEEIFYGFESMIQPVD